LGISGNGHDWLNASDFRDLIQGSRREWVYHPCKRYIQGRRNDYKIRSITAPMAPMAETIKKHQILPPNSFIPRAPLGKPLA
jgi:hypothetical protein